jgi:hypothetical protein
MPFQAVDTIYKMTVKALCSVALMVFCWLWFKREERQNNSASIDILLMKNSGQRCGCFCLYFIQYVLMEILIESCIVMGAELCGLVRSRQFGQLQVFLYLMPDGLLCLVTARLQHTDSIYLQAVKAL